MSRAVSAESVVLDLSLGQGYPTQAVDDCRTQLGLVPIALFDQREQLASVGELPTSQAMVSAGVDAETLGDRTVLFAEEQAALLTAALHEQGRTLLVIPPRPEVTLDLGATWLLRFLEEYQAPPQPHAPSAVPALPSPKLPLARLIPGLIAPELLRALESDEQVVVLPSGYGWVPPEARLSPEQVRRAWYDRLGALPGLPPWLLAWCQLRGNNLYVQPDFLAAQAWHAFGAADAPGALALLTHGLACSQSPAQTARLQAQRLGMRIATLDFDNPDSFPEPPPSAPEELRRFLFIARGWAHTFAGDPTCGEENLRRALATDQSNDPYLRNILALSRLRQDDPEGALAIEREIAAENDTRQDARLLYINALNTSRVLSRLGQHDESLALLVTAFDTTLGVRSDSDAIYGNALLARQYTRMGRPDDAAQAWLRAALHLVSCRVPEALAQRALRSLVPAGPTTLERVAEQVAAALQAAWSATAYPQPLDGNREGEGEPLLFLTPESGRFTKATLVLGAPGGAVVLGQGERPRVPVGLAPLRALVTRILHATLPSRLQATHTAVLVDRRLGRELPTTLPEAVGLAQTHGASQLLWEGIQHSVESLAVHSRLVVGDAVQAIEPLPEGLRLTFARYRPPLLLSGQEAEVFRGIQRQSDEAPLDDPLVRSLLEKRVLKVAYEIKD